MGKGKDKDKAAQTVGAAEADAALAFGLSLLLSIVLAAPVLWDVLEGRRSLEAGATRYLVCFVGARIAVGFVSHLYRTYRGMSQPEASTRADVPGDLTGSR